MIFGVFQISNTTCSLLLCRKATNFFILTWYLHPCYNHLLSQEVCLYVFLHFLHRWSCHLQKKKKGLFSSFKFCVHFTCFSCLIALAGISSIMMKSSGEKEHPYLVSYVTGKASSLSKLSMILAVDVFINQFCFIKLQKFSCTPSLLRVFKHEGILDFVKGFFCI